MQFEVLNENACLLGTINHFKFEGVNILFCMLYANMYFEQ